MCGVTDESKLKTLMESEGYTDADQMLWDTMNTIGCPAICMNEGCDATENLEPDCEKGWCGECGTGSMKSAFILKGYV